MIGQSGFIQDLRVPGMLHARLARPPNPGAKLVSIDKAPCKISPSVKVVHADFLGVVAEREEQAIRAAKQLKVEWQELRSTSDGGSVRGLRGQPPKTAVVAEQETSKLAFAGAAAAASARPTSSRITPMPPSDLPAPWRTWG